MNDFYSYMNSQNNAIALDERKPTGVHKDGTPCYKKGGPAFCSHGGNKDEVKKVLKHASKAELDIISKGGVPNKKYASVMPSDLESFANTNSVYRKLRNSIVALVRKLGLKDGIYPLVDVTNPNELSKLKPLTLTTGYMVTFQTTNGEGFNRIRKDLKMSDEEYDKAVEQMKKTTGSDPYVGVFNGVPELSFRCDSKRKALNLMRKYNQVAIYDNAAGVVAAMAKNANLPRSVVAVLLDNAMIPNKSYDWTENQVSKKK